jgi:hypothetical protein
LWFSYLWQHFEREAHIRKGKCILVKDQNKLLDDLIARYAAMEKPAVTAGQDGWLLTSAG